MTDYIGNLNHQYATFRDEARSLVGKFDTDAQVDENGIVTWVSNGSVPPEDILLLWRHTGKQFNFEASQKEKSRQLDEFTAAYRARQAERTSEEVAEARAMARAAVGSNVDMVNILTGERFRT